ncbi:MAG: AAA family ATPase [Planctomycetes bacterium]|nr:AAA family ATPase [Planctomycetota bacterium]
MHLSKVDIRNFRSFDSLTVDVQAGLNVLVGRNNTGKTNLLNAIRHALGPSASRGESLWLERDDFFRATPTVSPATSMSVTLTFTGLSEQQRSQFYEIVDFDLANLADSKAVIRFTAEWPAHKKQANIRRTGGPVSSAENMDRHRLAPPRFPSADSMCRNASNSAKSANVGRLRVSCGPASYRATMDSWSCSTL